MVGTIEEKDCEERRVVKAAEVPLADYTDGRLRLAKMIRDISQINKKLIFIRVEDFDLLISRALFIPKSNYQDHFSLQISTILDSIRFPQITFSFFSVCN